MQLSIDENVSLERHLFLNVLRGIAFPAIQQISERSQANPFV